MVQELNRGRNVHPKKSDCGYTAIEKAWLTNVCVSTDIYLGLTLGNNQRNYMILHFGPEQNFRITPLIVPY